MPFSNNAPPSTPDAPGGKPLSTRQKQILQYVTCGKSNKEIAYLLNIREKTVKNHMTTIMRKMQVVCRTQAAVQGLTQGLIQL